MKWLVAQPGPAFSVHDLFVGWCEALREAGQKVARYRLDDRLTFYQTALVEAGAGRFRRAMSEQQALQLAVDGLYSQLLRLRPDMLLVISGFFVPTDVYTKAHELGARVVIIHTETPYEDHRQVALSAHADLNLITDPTNLAAFRSQSDAYYQPQCYRETVHTPGEAKPDLECDLAFVGTGYPSRIGFLEQMDLSGLDVLLAGNWTQLADESPLRQFVAHHTADCLDNEDAVHIYRSAKVGINLYRREAQHPDLSQGWALGPREVEMAACGLFYLRDPRPEGDNLLPLPTFTDPGEASELLRHWLARPVQRQELAAKAREAIADRTFTNAAARLLAELDKQGSHRG